MMTLANEKVAPKAAPAPAAAAPAAPQTSAPTPEQLPEPLAAVARKEVPGILVPPLLPNTPPDPLQLFVVQNFDTLPQMAPVDYYDTQSSETVVFNTELLTAEQLAQAEKSGTLTQLLQPQTAAAPGGPAMSAEGTSLPAPVPQTPPMKAPPAKMQASLATARVRNMGGGPKVSPIQPNPVGQQLAKRPV